MKDCKEWSLDDKVDLLILTVSNQFWLRNMSRSDAMLRIKEWYAIRDEARQGTQAAVDWLTHGAFAGMYSDGKTYWPDHWTVAYGSIVAMQIVEIQPAVEDKFKKRQLEFLESQIKLAKKEVQEGDEWKRKDEEEE